MIEFPFRHMPLVFGPASSQFTRQFPVFGQINCFYEYDPPIYGWYFQLCNETYINLYIYIYLWVIFITYHGTPKRPSAKDLCKPPWRFGLQPPLQGLITAAVGPKVHLQKYVPKLGMHITDIMYSSIGLSIWVYHLSIFLRIYPAAAPKLRLWL